MSLTSKGNFKINDVEFSPKSLKISYESLAGPNSGRDLNGDMHIDWVKTVVRTFEITMPPSSASTIRTLFNLVQGKVYVIEFYDPMKMTYAVARVYTSTSSTDCYSGVLHNGLYQNTTFKAIEMEGTAAGGNS